MPIIFLKREIFTLGHELSGNETLAKKKLTDLKAKVEQGKKQFGFFYAEEMMTNLVEEKLN